ncbi:MAG: PRC-barrel domain-containing protein [Methanobacteriaceae archaeon]|jgi:sporulation protein YlmC with PRC-barrel domain|nr:PRC-barrel domain-containing protein [Candidatus Methanorudis spinitermitis]
MRIKKLLGMQVLDVDANHIGKIEDIEFAQETGEIEKIFVSLKKNILSNDETIIHYDNIKSIGDYVLLKITINQDE